VSTCNIYVGEKEQEKEKGGRDGVRMIKMRSDEEEGEMNASIGRQGSTLASRLKRLIGRGPCASRETKHLQARGAVVAAWKKGGGWVERGAWQQINC